MCPERHQFLNLRYRPARLNAEETAWFLGFHPHEISFLVSSRLLKPLGNPADNGVKHFCTVELELLRADPVWLSKATDAVLKYWKTKNRKRTLHAARMERVSSSHLAAA